MGSRDHLAGRGSPGSLRSSRVRRRLQPWVDFNEAQGLLFDGGTAGEQWAHLGTAAAIWLVLPLIVGLVLVVRSEVK